MKDNVSRRLAILALVLSICAMGGSIVTAKWAREALSVRKAVEEGADAAKDKALEWWKSRGDE